MNEKRGPGRPRKKPPTLEEIFKVAFELIDLKIDIAITELWLQIQEQGTLEADKAVVKIKKDFVAAITDHVKKWHPIYDPKELDRVLTLLREEFERRKHERLTKR